MAISPPLHLKVSMQEALQTADSTAAAALEAVADSAASVPLGETLTQAGELMVRGRFGAMGTRLKESITEAAVELFPEAVSALVVFLLLYIAYRVFKSVLSRMLRRSKRVDAGLESLLIKTFTFASLSLILTMVLAQFGIDVTTMLAGLSIVGIAVGFAARDTLENFFSGITILIDKPFVVGDNLVIDGTFGTVTDITLRSTRLRTQSNEIMVMPNNHMINNKLINHTMLGVLRISVPFGIAYKEYPQEARKVVLQLLEGDERIHPDYKPTVVVMQLNDSSVDMELRFYVRDPRIEIPIRQEFVERVREALRAAGIEIPFPHLQLFVDEAKAFEDATFMHTGADKPDHPGAAPL